MTTFWQGMWVTSHAFSWLRGRGSNPRQMDYTYLQVSLKDGLYHHPFGCRALRSRYLELLLKRIVSEPSWLFNQAWLLITLLARGLPDNSPCYHSDVSIGSCVIPACISRWQFAQMRMHSWISDLTRFQERVIPSSEIPKFLLFGFLWWISRASRHFT